MPPKKAGRSYRDTIRPTLVCRSRLLRGCSEQAPAAPRIREPSPSSEHALPTRRRRALGRPLAKPRRLSPAPIARAHQILPLRRENPRQTGWRNRRGVSDRKVRQSSENAHGRRQNLRNKSRWCRKCGARRRPRAIRPGRGFAQEKLGYFAQRCRFAAGEMPRPKTIIGGEPFRDVFHPARQFAGARKGRARFRRLMSLGPDQRIAEAGL